MKAFIVGATGFIGRGIAQAMQEAGYEVEALCRSDAAMAKARADGFTPIPGDMTEPGDWRKNVMRANVVVYAAQLRPGKRISGSWLAAARTARNQGLRNITSALVGSRECKAFIYTSGLVAHGSHGQTWIDETSIVGSHAMGNYHAEGEQITLAAAAKGVPAMVIRPGMVYGLGGTFRDFFLAEAQKGVYRFPGKGENYLSWVHIDDLGRAYVKAAEAPVSGEIVSVVDDHPLRLKDFAVALLKPFGGGKAVSAPGWLVSLFAGKPLSEMLTSSYRVTNRKAKQLLGWSPKYAGFGDGIPAVVEQFVAEKKPV